jgi:hypothetical protein
MMSKVQGPKSNVRWTISQVFTGPCFSVFDFGPWTLDFGQLG